MDKHIEDGCCSYDEASNARRNLIRAGIGIAALGGITSVFGDAFMETSYAATGKADQVLVVLSLRGAADGLSLVVPHGDPVYYAARPSIAVPKGKLWGGDAFFGLHPSLKPLQFLWDQGKMAAIHSAGQPVSSRSHFLAMEEIEDADPGSSERVGWLNRLVGMREDQHILQAVQWGTPMPTTQVSGPADYLSASNADAVRLAGPSNEWELPRQRSLELLWSESNASMARGVRQAIQVSKDFKTVRDIPATSGYPSGDLGSALASAARTIKANIGAEVITVDQGSWDHHTWIGGLDDGNLKRKAEELANCLANFFKDLGPAASKVTVVTISEFGRRVKENSNQGLDHGDGTVMFVMGDHVRGGYYGKWAGLENNENAGVPVTTDYRSVLSEVITSLYPERNSSLVFPGFRPAAVGFMKSVPPPPKEPTKQPSKPKPSLVKSWRQPKGTPKYKKTLTAAKPNLSTAGRGSKITYAWVVKGKVVSRKSTLKVKKAWRGRTVTVKTTVSKKGYPTAVKAASWKIKKK